MTTGDLLLRAILTDPGDDTARLVYADWLDEDGGEKGAWRAKMIRGQSDPAGPQRLVTTFPELWAVGLHPEAWVDGLRHFDGPVPWGYQVDIRRGFVERVELPGAAFTAELARVLFSAHPVTGVVLTGVLPYWNGRGYCLYRASCKRPSPDVPYSAVLPDAIYEYLDHSRGRYLQNSDRNVIAARVSPACVDWGRSLVVPPLDPLPARGD